MTHPSSPSVHDGVATPDGARVVSDPGELLAFFANDRAAHVYSLVDLEEPYWSASRWYRRGDAVAGVIANPADGLVTATGVSTRDPDGSSVLLAELAASLPAGLLLTGPAGLQVALASHRSVRWCEPHVKYALVDRAAVPAPSRDVTPLDIGDLDRLETMYAVEPGAAFFLPSMVADASFVGVADRSGALVAAAGTHLLSERQRVAAIGAVYVRPDHRGVGLGRAVTSGVIHRIADRCDVIGLNVSADNAPARAIYESIGFSRVLDYDEAELA